DLRPSAVSRLRNWCRSARTREDGKWVALDGSACGGGMMDESGRKSHSMCWHRAGAAANTGRFGLRRARPNAGRASWRQTTSQFRHSSRHSADPSPSSSFRLRPSIVASNIAFAPAADRHAHIAVAEEGLESSGERIYGACTYMMCTPLADWTSRIAATFSVSPPPLPLPKPLAHPSSPPLNVTFVRPTHDLQPPITTILFYATHRGPRPPYHSSGPLPSPSSLVQRVHLSSLVAHARDACICKLLVNERESGTQHRFSMAHPQHPTSATSLVALTADIATPSQIDVSSVIDHHPRLSSPQSSCQHC
ncbi:hypothetical protein EIP91_002996, partial [Steccherinum ochraceum]